jgi:hypothetical protein
MADGTDTQLVTLPRGDALTVFTTPSAIDPLLASIRKSIDGFQPDVTTKRGRDEIASIAYRVARSKTYLDGIGKDLADEQKEIPKKIDAARKRIRDTLDAWKDEVRKPLTEWEAAEKAREDAIKAAMDELRAVASDMQPRPSVVIAERLAEIKAKPITQERFGDLAALAAELKDKAIAAIEARLAEALKREAEAAELERLRYQAAVREEAEKAERAKQEAAERERRAAEAAAAAEKAKADAALKAAAEEAERKEREHKEALAAAERKAVEAAQKAKHEAEEAILREQAAKAKREADREHRATVNRAALAALVSGGIDEAVAKQVITLIAAGNVPAVSINY